MKNVKIWLAGIGIAASLVLGLAAPVAADVNNFTITDFAGDYTLDRSDPQGQLHIVEHIKVNFEAYNHGILRAIPLSYKHQKLLLTINKISSLSGAPAQYTTYDSNGNEVLKIGDPAQTVTGQQEYDLDYTLHNVVSFYNDHDELYWDINGDQWSQPFEHVQAIFHLPSRATTWHAPACFAGSFGSSASNCQIAQEGATVVASATNLGSNQTLTVVTGFQKGYFQPPSLGDRIAMYIRPAAELLLLPLIVGGIGLSLWLKRGRDAKGTGVIVPQYSPPDGLTPLAAGTLIDFKVDDRDITAMLIDLARRGYMKIIETKDDRLILKDKLTYTLQLTNADFSGLNTYERTAMEALFPSAQLNDAVDISASKNKLYKVATDIRKQTEQELTTLGYFRANPLSAGKLLYGVTVGLFIVIYIVGSHLGAYLGIGAGVALALAWLFARAMPARTAKGTAAKEQILGLKLYMDVAEKDRIKMLQGPDAPYASNAGEPVKTVELFEKLLPYAMVLGVEKQWAGQFESLYTQPPSWYSGNWAAFNAGYFVGSLNSGFGGAVNTAFASPSSSGGSGFSGGAGGGGGGGGGGGW